MGKITVENEIRTFGTPLYGLSHPNPILQLCQNTGILLVLILVFRGIPDN